ncbi:protein ALP1-like isoform X2 [Anoplophora glabripennis]|uniref:protein ALP1-like isoform X2 n=1 Tax=Anoplophora glabripennis TaxID=217634 RepID=UPI000C768038|nr:protein ALP1-like isoform X2 [Anoplophora glabripennis]
MRLSDHQKYINYLRMSGDTFHKLLNIVGPRLTKIYCVREPISPGERFALTLSGDSMMSISYAFRVGHNTVSKIIRETCDTIWECLNQNFWLKIAEDFEEKWQLPHCVGALDGKHVVIQALPRSGSIYYNYKGTHSIVLLALCDANYKFTVVDIGAQGRHSDGGIFKNSNIGKLIISNNLNLPAPSPLEQYKQPMNYYICADEAFPLSTTIMRPYAGNFLPQTKRIFNYRLCRGRRVIENTFGILASRWRIYRKPIIASETTVVKVIKATVCLHNFLMTFANTTYFTPSSADQEDNEGELIEGEWRKEQNSNLRGCKKNKHQYVWATRRRNET